MRLYKSEIQRLYKSMCPCQLERTRLYKSMCPCHMERTNRQNKCKKKEKKEKKEGENKCTVLQLSNLKDAVAPFVCIAPGSVVSEQHSSSISQTVKEDNMQIFLSTVQGCYI